MNSLQGKNDELRERLENEIQTYCRYCCGGGRLFAKSERYVDGNMVRKGYPCPMCAGTGIRPERKEPS